MLPDPHGASLKTVPAGKVISGSFKETPHLQTQRRGVLLHAYALHFPVSCKAVPPDSLRKEPKPVTAMVVSPVLMSGIRLFPHHNCTAPFYGNFISKRKR